MSAARAHVARRLCFAAATDNRPEGSVCPHCHAPPDNDAPCTMWPGFLREADHAIEAVRDFNLLTPRKKPRRPVPPFSPM